MSTFNGKLLEYPFASIDRFDGENLASTIFFLSHCHKDHIEGLLAIDFIEVLRNRRTVKLYTSETTKNLMSCDDEMVHLLEFTIGLPIHQQQVLTVKDHQNKDQNLVVTLLSAGHCVGSVMFLIEGSGGKVLYTGDFRLGEKEISKIPTSFCNVKSVYVDTTFCCPLVPDFPTRVDTTEAIISIIKSWIEKGPNYMIHLKCKGRYGYEYIMKEVAKKFKTKLHVNEWRLKFSSKLPYMLEHFTTTSHHTQIHCCYYGRLSTSSAKALPCGMHFIDGRPCKVLTIVPSSLIFIQNGEIPKEGKIWNTKQHIWRVFHSMHASYNEMRILLRYLKPQNIYPFVPPADCQDVIVAYNRLQDLQCKENETMDDSTQTNLERSLPIEENTTWKQGLERAKPVKITSPPQMKNTSRLFSPPPARRKKKRSCASNLNHTNERMVTSSKRLSLDESRSSKKMTSLEDSACDQVASLKTSSTAVVTGSANLDDRQLFSPSKGLQDNFTKTGKVNSPFKQRAEDVSFLSKSPIHRIERACPSPKRKDKEEPDIVFVEEGRQIVEETQDLVISKLTNQQKILTNAEKRYHAPHEAQHMNIRNQVENKSKKNDFKIVPITFVENALEENQDKSHSLENPLRTIIERTSQIIEEDSQCGENESKAKTNAVESVLRSSLIEDSENSYTEQSPNKCKTSSKISDFSDTKTTVQRSSEIKDSEFSAVEDSECSVVDRKQTNRLRSQGTYQKSLDSNTTQRSSRIEEASENSFKDHSPKKMNDDSQKTIRYLHNSSRRIIEEFSQVIEDFSEENFSQSTEDYSNAITNTEITEDETNRIVPSNAEIERRNRSPSIPVKGAGVTIVKCDSESNSVNLKVGSSPNDNSIRTVQYSVFNETGKFKKVTELGHSVDGNPSDDVAAERNVQNDDVINISSGDEDDTVSESEEDNDSTLSLIESDENSLDNSMEFSQVF